MSHRYPHVYNDNVWNGWLERCTGYRELTDGGGLRPCDGIELCLRLCEIEEACGSIPRERIDPETWVLVEKFSRWQPTPKEGQLAEMVCSECKRLVAESNLS